MSDTTNAALIAEARATRWTLLDGDEPVLEVRLADALEAADARKAEHDRAVAEKAWDEGALWRHHADGTHSKGRIWWQEGYPDEPVNAPNPYRANPEPKEGE